MPKFHIKDVDNLLEWDAFVEKSPQGTLFSHSDYLKTATQKYRLIWVYKGNQRKAGVALVLNEDKTSCVLDDLVIYNAILFLNDKTQKETKARFERFEIAEFVIGELGCQYNRIELALSPHFEDMRPFFVA